MSNFSYSLQMSFTLTNMALSSETVKERGNSSNLKTKQNQCGLTYCWKNIDLLINFIIRKELRRPLVKFQLYRHFAWTSGENCTSSGAARVTMCISKN